MKKTIVAFLIIMASCNNVGNINSENIDSTENLTKLKADKLDSDSIFETAENIVVFLMPGDAEIEKMKSEYSEEDFAEIVADITWYPGVAAEYLDSIGIKNKILINQKFLILKKSNGEKIKFQKEHIEGNMIMFRNDTLPIIGYAVNFDGNYAKRFFKK